MGQLKLKIAVSQCLTGARVRYNGEGKRHSWLMDQLGEHADFITFCPEVAMGLSVPRPPMRLSRHSGEAETRLVVTPTKEDLTRLARDTADKLAAKQPEDVDAFILMQKSPMCGLKRVKVYGKNDSPNKEGVGFFAEALRQRFPNIPIIEAGRLSDPLQRQRFVFWMFTYAAFRRAPKTVSGLQAFHRAHKFLLLAHNRQAFESLGRTAADARKQTLEQDLESYATKLTACMHEGFRRGPMADALTHVYGFLKADMHDGQKEAIRKNILDYRSGQIPLVSVLRLLEFANFQAQNLYVKEQVLLHPNPDSITVGTV